METIGFTSSQPTRILNRCRTGQSVGADFGMKDAYLTLSTSEKIQHPQPLKQSLTKLRKLNKALSRKQKGSGGWWRAVRELARLYRAKTFIGNSPPIFVRLDTIAIETLNLKGMKKLWGRSLRSRLLPACLLKQVGRWTATCSDCGFHNDNTF